MGRKRTGVDTATDAVEACSVGRVGIGSYATALVGSGTDGTVHTTNEGSADGQRLGICAGKATTGVGVECRLIVRVIVHTLDDIDFASSRPVGSCKSISAERNEKKGCLYRYSTKLAMYHTQPACARSLRQADRQCSYSSTVSERSCGYQRQSGWFRPS